MDPEQKPCAYCGAMFTPTPKHAAQKLMDRGEKLWCFCSIDCRRQMIEQHVGFEEKHVEYHPDLHGRTVPANYFDEMPEHDPCMIAGLAPEQADKLRAFFAKWIALPPGERDTAALTLAGVPGAVVSKRFGVSPQATSQRLRRARLRCPTLARAIPIVPGHERPSPKGINGAHGGFQLRVGTQSSRLPA